MMCACVSDVARSIERTDGCLCGTMEFQAGPWHSEGSQATEILARHTIRKRNETHTDITEGKGRRGSSRAKRREKERGRIRDARAGRVSSLWVSGVAGYWLSQSRCAAAAALPFVAAPRAVVPCRPAVSWLELPDSQLIRRTPPAQPPSHCRPLARLSILHSPSLREMNSRSFSSLPSLASIYKLV